MPRNIHVPTVLPPEDAILQELGESTARWIYGELWRRLRAALANGEGPLADAIRAEVDVMVTEATDRCAEVMRHGRPRVEIDRLLDEKYTLVELQEFLAPPVPLPELVAEEPLTAARPRGPVLKDGEEPL